jgi:glycine oxidase
VTVTIIGAGVVGLSIAYELVSRGASVRIVDARGIGMGATKASAGILAPHIEGHSDTLLRLGICGLAQYDAFVARVGADAGQAVEYRRSGTLQVALKEADAQPLSVVAQRLTAAGTEHALLDAGGARALEPALGEVVAALRIPHHGYVGVSSLMVALTGALRRRGVTVAEEHIERLDAIDTDAVVVATGSWSGELRIDAPAASGVHPPADVASGVHAAADVASGVHAAADVASGVHAAADVASGFSRKIPVRPVRGQLLHLRLPRPVISQVVWGERCYLVPWSDGSVLVGATSEEVGFDERSTAAGVHGLLEHAMELVPGLASASFEEVRVGLRPATSDELPIVGASSTMRRVFYATGHYRNGVLLAPLTALAVADLILEGRERSEFAAARPARFGL